MTPVSPEVSVSLVFMKRLMIPPGLQEPAQKPLNNLVSKAIFISANSATWATPTVSLVKGDEKTRRICVNYHFAPNQFVNHSVCIILESKNNLDRIRGSTVFSWNLIWTMLFHIFQVISFYMALKLTAFWIILVQYFTWWP